MDVPNTRFLRVVYAKGSIGTPNARVLRPFPTQMRPWSPKPLFWVGLSWFGRLRGALNCFGLLWVGLGVQDWAGSGWFGLVRVSLGMVWVGLGLVWVGFGWLGLGLGWFWLV